MHRFDLHLPSTLDEAHRTLAAHEDARILAGGTALMILMRERLVRPSVLVSLSRIPELEQAVQRDSHLALGAMATIHAVSRWALARERLPLLAEALALVGNIRVRTMGTIGGSLCEADYQSDLSPVLAALGATVVLSKPGTTRSIPVADFFTGLYETALQDGEILVGVDLPLLPPGSGTAYLKHVTGPITDRPCLGVAAIVTLDEKGDCRDVRVAVGGAIGMTSRPLLVSGLSALAAGNPPTDDLIDAMAEEAHRQSDPMSDLRATSWYRKEMTPVFTRRALRVARERARVGRA